MLKHVTEITSSIGLLILMFMPTPLYLSISIYFDSRIFFLFFFYYYEYANSSFNSFFLFYCSLKLHVLLLYFVLVSRTLGLVLSNSFNQREHLSFFYAEFLFLFFETSNFFHISFNAIHN